MAEKTIINKVKNTKTILWSELQKWEFNELKDASRDVSKLINSIINDGFIAPFFVWADHQYVIDGNGRNLALQELEKRGYKIGELPIVEIEAKTKQEAKAMVLKVSSKYGYITQESFANFSLDLDMDSMLESIQLPDIRLDFLNENVEDDKDYSEKNKEVNLENLNSESTLVFKYSHQMYLQVLDLINNAKEKMECETNEETLLKILEDYE
ncbi:MAG: ParB N-terminal domain-containing protein [Patescibacteria group bacterium]